MALLEHEVELHYHSLGPMASQNPQLAIAQELKQKYGESKLTRNLSQMWKTIRVLHTRCFFRAVEAVEPCKFTQMTAFSVIVAYWLSFSLELYLRICMAGKQTKKKASSAARWTEVYFD